MSSQPNAAAAAVFQNVGKGAAQKTLLHTSSEASACQVKHGNKFKWDGVAERCSAGSSDGLLCLERGQPSAYLEPTAGVVGVRDGVAEDS